MTGKETHLERALDGGDSGGDDCSFILRLHSNAH